MTNLLVLVAALAAVPWWMVAALFTVGAAGLGFLWWDR